MSLRRNAFQVKQAHSGPDALRIIREESCDYVVSDVCMSPMDGFTLSKQIYRDYPWIEIILMSAYAFEENSEQSTDTVPFHKIKKPFEINELVQLLKEKEKEKKGRVKKTIAYCGDSSFSSEVCKYLKKAGFNAVDLEQVQDDKEKVCDLYLIDCHILDSQQWKILNQIDFYSPDSPVIILAESHWKTKDIGDQEANIIVLDRHEFFSDPENGIAKLCTFLR